MTIGKPCGRFFLYFLKSLQKIASRGCNLRAQFLTERPLQAFAKTTAFHLVRLVVGLLLLTQAARADLKSYSGAETAPNIAEITVLDDGVAVALEIYVGDLKLFSDLLPDKMLRAVPQNRPSQIERLKQFSSVGLSIRDGAGNLLRANLKLLELRERIERYSPYAGLISPTTGQINPKPPADSRVIYVELFYPFNTERPDVLVVTPPLDESGTPIATIGFVARHRTVPVNNFRYLAQPEQLNLNWDDPWYSAFNSKALTRHYKDAMTSFLYVEPREVRHEALLRVRDIEYWIDLDLENRTEIAPDAQGPLKQQIAAFFATKSPLKIDGVLTQPDKISAVFVAIKPQGVVTIDGDAPIDLATAMVGVILTYRVTELPQEVTVDWQLFSPNQSRIFTNTIDAAGPFNGFVEPDDAQISWKNYLKTYEEPEIAPVSFGDERKIDVPVFTVILLLLTVGVAFVLFRTQAFSTTVRAVILGGLIVVTGASARTGWATIANPLAGIPDETAALRIVGQLTENLHNALRENAPDRLDSALEISVSGAALEDVKQELQRALIIEIQGGGAATVNEIDDVSVDNIRSMPGTGGFQASTKWSVKASGNHWGHPHKKNIRFTALMDIAPVDGLWKLAGITVTSAQAEN